MQGSDWGAQGGHTGLECRGAGLWEGKEMRGRVTSGDGAWETSLIWELAAGLRGSEFWDGIKSLPWQ